MKNRATAHDSKERLGEVSRRICEEFGLSKAYFAEVLQKRRHYVAGYGQEGFVPTEEMRLSENLAFFWQGNLAEADQHRLQAMLARVVSDIEKELKRK